MKPATTTEDQKESDAIQSEDASISTHRKRRNPFNLQQRKEDKERRQKKRARIIVRNISFKATEDALRRHFSQWGPLEEVNLLKRADGKLVGCAFVQYETINQATKAILQANGKELLGRQVFVDWALGKNEFQAKQKVDGDEGDEEPKAKKPKAEVKDETEEAEAGNAETHVKSDEEEDEGIKSENDDGSSDDEAEHHAEAGSDGAEESESDEDKKELKSKLDISNVKKEKHISNDVEEGCTVFVKNVPFDADEKELRKLCRQYGLVQYVIINREPISGHSKGTAFVKFKIKDSADMFLRGGDYLVLRDEVLQPFPALSRSEIRQQAMSKQSETKDSRNLYLAREGLITSGSKAAEGVSAADMTKRHQLEQIKTQVLKNLNRFISRNRLSIHNLPLNYDNDNLKQLAVTYTGFRPHECRVMRENSCTPEHPKGKSKGFGFLSFSTHQEALTALRNLNNNPKIFGAQHRPIVAFSIEDRAAHQIKEKRAEKSKLNNPTFKDKLERRKEQRKQKLTSSTKAKLQPKFGAEQNDDKQKLRKHIERLEKTRAAKAQKGKAASGPQRQEEDFVGMAAKPGTSLNMRSKKKIAEQSQEHMKRVKATKRKAKQHKIKQMHLEERRAVDRTKQRPKVERDDLAHLVNKYKRMLDGGAQAGGGGAAARVSAASAVKVKKPKRNKWYKE